MRGPPSHVETNFSDVLRLLRAQPRLLQRWLTLKDGVLLDSAFCCHGSRDLVLSIEDGQLFTAEPYHGNRDLDSMLRWINSRNAQLDGLSCSDELLETFLARSGSEIRWIRSYNYSTECQQVLLETIIRCPHVAAIDIMDAKTSLEWDDCLYTVTSTCQNLTRLSLAAVLLSPEGLAVALSRCRRLRGLALRTPEQIIPVDIALPTLTSIEICSTRMNDAVLVAIGAKCAELRTLRVFSSSQVGDGRFVTDVGVLAVLQGCPLLRETDVEQAAGISYELRVELARRGDFQCLKFALWRDISDQLAQGVLAVSPKVTEVDFGRCAWVTDAALISCAQHCPLVEHVTLVDCPGVTTHGVRVLVSALGSRVRSVDLRGCHQLSAGAVLAIAEHCPLLERFYRPPCVSDKVVAKLVERCAHLTPL
jgi:hypothetical protein